MLSLVGFLDSNQSSRPDYGRSIRAYCIYFGDNLMSWMSSMQKVVSKFSVDVEYCIVTLAACQVIWLTSVLKDLSVESFHKAIIFT